MNAREIELGEFYWAATPDGEALVRVMWPALGQKDSWVCTTSVGVRMIFESREFIRAAAPHVGAVQ